MGSEITEFVNQVRDQVRIRHKRMSSIAENCTEHSIIWGMFMATTLNAATFMGKNFSTIQSSVKNFEDLTLKQMFYVTAQLVNNQEEIHGLDKFSGKRILGNVCHWLVMKPLSIFKAQKSVFSDSVLCFGRILHHPDSNEARKNRIARVKSVRSYRDFDGINGESAEFEWNIFPGFTTLHLCVQNQRSTERLGTNTRNFHRKNSICVNVQ